jgi:KDO2-lipid IV(A) lauroyltransferase
MNPPFLLPPGRRWISHVQDAARGVRRRSMFLTLRWLMRRTGFDGARHIGGWLGEVHFSFGNRIRRQCKEGLSAWMGLDIGDPWVSRTLREAYRVNTTAVLEVLSMVDRRLEPARLHQLCHVEGITQLLSARQGRGAILLATHSGNSLLLAAQLADLGWPVSIVYRHTRMMSKEFFAEGLPRYGFEAILANEGFRAYARMADALRRDRLLFAMMDQGVEVAQSGLPMRFLGKDMPMPGGVVQLARQSRAPVLPVLALASQPAWEFAIQPPLHLTPGGTIEDDTAAILGYLEQQIRLRPHLWSWPHRRWRNYPIAGGPAG